jgi:hypothetical protein
MTVLVWQVVFARPSCDLLRLPIRSSVAILPAPVAFVEEPLVVALQLVVQDDPIHSAALLAEALLGAQVGAIDLRVVRQLARLSEAGVEPLARLTRAFVSLVPIRLEEIPAALRQDDSAVVRAEWTRAQQALLFEVALGSASVLAAVVEIAFRHDSERTDGGEHAAFRAVDLVHAIALSHRPALASPRQVEILCEHIARVAIGGMTAFAAPATAASAAVVEVVALMVT